MKVLFVSRETREHSISTIVFAQGESLRKRNVAVEYFLIKGKGLWGYVRSIFTLRKYLKRNGCDVVHAHYSLSGFVAAMAGSRPLIVSLMGSDVHNQGFYRWLIRAFYRLRRAALIVKSEAMKKALRLDAAAVIPNGVDIDKFRPLLQPEARRRVGFNEKKQVIFIGNPQRPEKNFQLAEDAVRLLPNGNVVLQVVSQQPHDRLPDFMNAADVLLLTSIYEGSPNVIKEAMACNCPIVATDVGDIRRVFGDTAGCFLASFDPRDVAEKIAQALAFGRRTQGRERLRENGLDDGSIAKRLMQVYEALKGQ